MKIWIIPIMLGGCLLFNCLFVGGYQIYEAGKEWMHPKVEFDFMALDTLELLDLKKQIEAEIKFRQTK